MLGYYCFIESGKNTLNSQFSNLNCQICENFTYHHKRGPLNSAFANNLDDFIAESRIDVWIYGHSHTNIDTDITGTKVVCNQLGYVQYGEHQYGFDGRKFIEV